VVGKDIFQTNQYSRIEEQQAGKESSRRLQFRHDRGTEIHDAHKRPIRIPLQSKSNAPCIDTELSPGFACHFRLPGQLFIGGLCIFAGDAPLFQTLKEQSATHSIVIPMEFIALKSLNHRNALPPGLKILIVGGSLTPADRAAWREVCPTGTLIELYGTNESGTIAEMQSDTRGKIIPELEVQVVDDNDIPLPYGKEGTIRLRGEPCATHYLFEEHPRPERFRDGWFYPGDKAILEDANHLQLLGRDDDLLNVRGYKIPAAAIEEIVKGFPEVEDCCATTIQDPLDDGAIWLGVRFSPNADFSDIQQKLKSHLPIKADVHLYTVDTIPRGPSGKIQRHTVAARFRHHIHSAAQKKAQSTI
jgi:acyl-coenzyme A synthetase/AMP-(fatty) acid ligase